MKKREKRRRCWLSPPPLYLLILISTFPRITSSSLLNFTRPESETVRFNHLAIDRNTGRVFIGAVNWLYQLLPNLNLEMAERTGPEEDSPECPVSRDCPTTITKITDNVNKILVIDYMQGRLITCGSLFQGLCVIRKTNNISLHDPIVNEPVAANNGTASTVAFIAPGPPNPPTTHVLYVGVSYTGNGPYRTDVPAVCSRSLESNKMLSIAAVSVTTGTRILVNTLARERYPINYIYGFASRGFSYFLTTQKRIIDSQYPFMSKLIRICHKDPDYYSYTEIPIECRSEGKERVDYNLVQAAYLGKPGSELAVDMGITSQEDVLYAVFSQSKNDSDVYDKASARSALCVYSLRGIHRKFTQNIQHCFSGNGDRGLDFINPSVKCVHTQLVISDDFCGTDVNTPLGGLLPITASPVISYLNPQLTAVAATSTHDFTVAFLGTSTGQLIKVVVESSKTAYQYSDLEVDRSSPVNADLLFDPNKEFIYVMTERKLTRLKVQECHVYKTCGECLGAKDPYCGWCSLENKCSLRSECAQASQDPLYWLSYRSGKCTTITNVQPFQIQRTTARTLQLTIDNLPTLSGQFVCVFTESESNKPLNTNATRTAMGVSCPTPRTDSLPAIPAGQHHFTAKLSVKNWNGPEFVATNFTFYDCNTYSSCTQCVSSAFPCDWCVDGHRCTHDTGENCRNDILVTGINNIGPSIRSGPGFCPRINSTVMGGSTELLVPYESIMRVSVKVDNMALLEDLKTDPQFIMQTRFVCQFNIDGRVKQVNAQLLGDTIYCENMEFKYNSNSSNITATFAVIWGGSKPLDNPDNIHVLVYRCPYMAENCGMCLALPEKYKCGWCQSSDKCQVTDQCDGRDVAWLDRQKTCPNPRILDFHPRTGPLEGGTKVTIRGINLGKTFEDIQGGVTVAGHQCIPVKQEYIRTSQIVCEIKTPDLPPTNMHKGPVIVKVQDSFRGDSDMPFMYVSPTIRSIKPRKGPQSGGTRLSITGDHMNAGSTIQAFIDDLPCKIVNTSKHHAECITSRSDRRHEGELRMKFDHGERTLKEMNFHYVEDPSISSVESGPLVQKGVVRGIPSGGITIRVHGKHFDAVQGPEIYVVYNSKKFRSPCHVGSPVFMQCKSPSIPIEGPIDADNPRRLDVGFTLDNVVKYKNYNLSLFPNPKYWEFEDKNRVKYYKSDYLTINGENLDLASKESDVKVQIGTSYCNVTSLSRSQLTCRPPTSQPPALNDDGQPDSSQLPDVVVIVGDNLRYNIGYLSYESPVTSDATLPNAVIIGVALGGGLLLVIVIAILIAYRIKSTESNRVLKNLQEQMDILELRVAAECKESFAELQTEMTDLTSDLTFGGIPFRDYGAYAMKNLFPTVEDHPVLRELDIDPHRRQLMEKGLRQFGQLVMNKTFLLLFIRTLESNRYFSMRDRVNVASLIMVTLQGKMEYCTDILKTLLAELIEKCLEGNSHPKLLLRRTESVAEKMLSAWFTFLLYKFLKECAGEPLFVLYRAIKQQVDKGPVDAITSEARYSLSEEKLIRQSIEYKGITVFVSISPQTSYVTGLDPHSESMDLPVKVLDCDTISQVKEKALDTIYKSTPFSQRPCKDDLDLEWRTGMTGRLILSDEDTTTRTDSEWKKLNTLAHFKVQEGAQLTLVPKQSSMYNLSILSEKSEKSHKYETLNFNKLTSASPPLSRAISPLKPDPETGYKYWHLVKHHDSDHNKEGERSNKMVSEIYLTRLLATKGTLQKFVDDLFETIFSTAHRGSALPLAIKYMFDFLDDQALQHGITDPEVVHTWKSNSLPLRFWVNLIKNPNFVFDIHKSNIVDSCLSVVAQTFMDSCSTSDHRLGKDSPSSKLLYAKDIPIYKEWVDRYYQDIKLMQAISDQDMNAMLAEESRMHASEFNTNCALYELYSFAVKYNDQLIQTLEDDEFSKKNKLAYKLEHVHSVMAGESEA